ncbi:MAG: glycosyltransferase [Ignavibacteriaceae bacterium]|nr:glycosyltransferase [Ignavibacteriaceae bacterium]
MEVGVRTGGSLVQALHGSSVRHAVLVDLWSGSYADLPNTKDYTEKQLTNFQKQANNNAKLEYIQGNSHHVLKELINQRRKFDLINVDGDHEEAGAWEDLIDAEKLLSDAGAIVFDDIIHPAHKYLEKLIPRFLNSFPSFNALVNNTQDNGVVILLKNISPEEFLKEEIKLRVAEDYSQGADLTEVGQGSTFAESIQSIFSEVKPKKIIETGTYLGTGTTSIIAEAMKNANLKDAKFYSIEINPENHLKAKDNLAQSGLLKYVNLLNGLSVPRSVLPTKDEITKTTIKHVEYNNIFVDHREDERAQLYFQETDFPDVQEDLLGKTLAEFNFNPDFILLDSAGYMGFLEFQYLLSKLKGDCIIALDDIYHIKHHKSFLFMQDDSRFEIMVSSKEKFGFCVAKFKFNPDIKVENNFSNLNDKETINCLLCGSDKSTIMHAPDIVKCSNCGMVYLKERPNQKWMENYYKTVYAVDDPAAAVTVAVPADVKQLDTKKEYIAAQRRSLFEEAVAQYGNSIEGKTLVDIGCGWGGLLYNARKYGLKVIGYEFTQHNVNFARNVLNLDVRQAQFADSNLPPNSVDIVTMSHVLEHVPDPVKLVKKINEVLTPGGIFFCVVPNFYSLCSAYLGEKWAWLDRDWHYTQFTVDSITNLFVKSGFVVEKLTTQSGDFGSVIPKQILKIKFPEKTDDELAKLLIEVNEQNFGEEITIVGKKPATILTDKLEDSGKNILWIRTDAIGDCVLASSMLKPLKEFYSDYKITVVCQNIVKELYETSPYVDNIISFDKRRIVLDTEYRNEIISKIQALKAEIAFNSIYSRDILADYLTINSGADTKIAHDGDLSNILPHQKEENNKLYSRLVKNNPSSFSELARHQDFLMNIGTGSHKLDATIWLADADLNYAENIFTEHKLNAKKTVALFAGAQHEVRVYNDYGKAINEYCVKNGFTVILLGSSKDSQVNQANAKDLTVNTIDLTGATSIRQSAAILKKCAAAVGAETGLAHIACAVGTPNLILLGGGHFGRFMPYSNLTSIVALPLECFGCNWQCKYGTTTCVKDVDYKIISLAFENMIENSYAKTTLYLQSDYRHSFLSSLPRTAGVEKWYQGECEIKIIDPYPSDSTQNFLESVEKSTNQKIFKLLEKLYKLYNLNSLNVKDYAQYEKNLLVEKKQLQLVLTQSKDTFENNSFYHYLKGLFFEQEDNSEASVEEYVSSLKHCINNRVLYKLAGTADSNALIPYSFYLYQELATLGVEKTEMMKKAKHWSELLAINNSNTLTRIDGDIPLPKAIVPKLNNGNSSVLVSFVVPSKNRVSGLSEFLSSLNAACVGIDYEVLLYIGGELDDSYKEAIKKYNIKKVFRDEEIFGNNNPFSWTKLMNHGFSHSAGQWIMYASDDIVLHPFAVNFALQKSTDKKIGGISFLHRNTVQNYDGFFKEYGFEVYGKRPFINFGIIRKEAFVKARGFDEDIIFYAGDSDFCWRVVESGYKIIPSYYSLVEHINIEDAIKVFNSGKVYRIDTYYFLKKWKNYINSLKDKTLVKERFILPDITNIKKHILKTAVQNNIPINDILLVDNEYEQFTNSINTVEEKTIKVSAIVSTYNSESFIKGCLDDLIEQTLYKSGELEIVVIDSGSEENEGKIIKEYQKKYSDIIYERTEKETIYSAWNRGIKLARGKYITNANTDDRHAVNALEKLAQALDANESIGVTYADMYKTIVPNDCFTSNSKKAVVKWMDFDPDLLLFGCFVGPQPMWQKALHEKYGMFDDALEVVGDYEFWLRLSSGVRFYHLKEVLGLYFYSDKSAEHRNENITKSEDDKIRDYYLIKNISTKEDVSRILSKIELIGAVKELKDYYEKAKGFIMLRQNGLQIEEQLKSVIADSSSYNAEDLITTLEQLITVLTSSDVLLDKEKYLTILYNLCGVFYLKENIAVKAKLSFENALSINPESSEACAGLGEIFILEDDLDAAKTMFEWAAKFDSENKSAANRLQELTDIEIQKNSVPIVSDNGDMLKNKLEDFLSAVDSLVAADEYEKSLNLLKQSQQHFTELEPSEYAQELQSKFAVLYGFAQLGLDNIEEAKECFEESMELNPESSEACRGLGEVFIKNDMPEEAAVMFESAVKIYSSNIKAISRLNELYGSPETITAVETVSTKKEKLFTDAYNLFAAKKYNEAKSLLTESEIKLSGELNHPENNMFSSAFYNLQGFNYLALNLHKNAQGSFEQALQYNPDSPKACYGLGEVFFINKEDRSAKAMFEWAVKNDPSDQLSISGLSKINRVLNLNEQHNSLNE